ncbi:MAG TPA: tail fiber domain-containing protein [Rhizomicrobium sp.]
MSKLIVRLIAAIALLIALSSPAAATCPTFTTLANGTTADATAVMQNFDYILQCPNFTGNVGIGTTTPATTLELFGSSVSLRVNNGSNSTTLSQNQLSTIGGPLYFNNGAAENVIFCANTSCNVGIGTSLPTSQFENYDTDTQTANYSSVLFDALDTSSTPSINKIGVNIQSTGAWTGSGATNTGLLVNVAGATLYNYAATFTGGSVGIGTTTPAVALDVTGSPATNSAGTEDDLHITRPASGTYWPQLAAFKVGTYNTSGGLGPDSRLDINLKAAASGALGADTNVMTLLSNGYVGIGITAPTAQFENNDTDPQTVNYSSALFNALDTSSTASINKIGVNIQSTGAWTGTGAVNTGLVVNVAGATTNYAATFSGGNVGIGIANPTTTLEIYGSMPALSVNNGGVSTTLDQNQLSSSGGPLYINHTSGENVEFCASASCNVSIGAASPSSQFENYDTDAESANYTSNLFDALNTSSTASVNKTGVSIQSTGAWTGTGAVNTGLAVNVAGGTTNYAATFSGGNVGIGTVTPSQPLYVNGIAEATSYYLPTGSGNGVGFWNGAPTTYGILMSNSATYQYGGVTDYYIANIMSNGTGRGFVWSYGATPSMALNASSGNLQIAGAFTAVGTSNSSTFASSVGIETTTPAYTLQVNGSVAGTSAYVNTSDARLKKDVRPIDGALAIVEQLHGVRFQWRASDERSVGKSLNLPAGQPQIGFIAQDLQKVLPEAVSVAKGPEKLMSVGESKVVPVLVEAVKELKAANDHLMKDASERTAQIERESQELAEVRRENALLKSSETTTGRRLQALEARIGIRSAANDNRSARTNAVRNSE